MHSALLQLFMVSFCLLCYFSPNNGHASSETTSPTHIEAQKIIKAFYARELSGFDEISKVFPKHWITENANLEEDKLSLQTQLSRLDSQNELSQHEIKSELELTRLKLIWLYFNIKERNEILSATKTNGIAAKNHSEAKAALDKSTATIKKQVAQQQEIRKTLERSDQDREKRLLELLLDLETQLGEVAGKVATIGKAKAEFSQSVSLWQSLSLEIQNALEDEQFIPDSQNFSHYRNTLRKRLDDSNQRLKGLRTFIYSHFNDDLKIAVDDGKITPQSRDSDNDSIREIITQIHSKRISLTQAIQQFDLFKREAISEILEWQPRYRTELLNLRGKLIAQVIDKKTFALNHFSPLLVEADTIYTSFLFHRWKKDYIALNGHKSDSLITFSKLAHLLKLLTFACLVVWCYTKRNSFTSGARKWCLQQTSSPNWRIAIRVFFDLLRDLYLFIILFLLGGILIKLMIRIGISSAVEITPHLNNMIIFFLFWGVVNYLCPLLSQREIRQGQNHEEVEAMETVLAFFPKIILMYWLLSVTIHTTISTVLNESLLAFHLVNALALLFIIVIFLCIWLQRGTWRLINEKAYNSHKWQQISLNAMGKFWEPLVLLCGGGMGVYRVAWNILLDRLGDIELTRSFQAMLSRALLERKYRRKTKTIHAERFSEKYWRAFNVDTPVEEKWYVKREEIEAGLEESYHEWLSEAKPNRVLLLGDRGIGKSALISNFLHKNQASYLHSKINNGEANSSALIARLSMIFLGSSISSHEEFVDALMQLEPKILCLDNLENSMLRRVGGFSAFSLLIDIILRTSEKHFWILTCSTYAWTIANHGIIGANCFTKTLYLPGLEEPDLQKLLLSRHNAAHSSEPDFSALNLGQKKTPAKSRLVRMHQESLSAQEKGRLLYFRILWDYTKGNPRQAIYYWKTSLSWDGEKCQVNLFEVPEQRILETLHDRTLMLLAGLIEHNGLTIQGAINIMNYEDDSVRRMIEELAPYDIIYSEKRDDIESWYVESFWTKAVENYLEKRQLLFKGDIK